MVTAATSRDVVENRNLFYSLRHRATHREGTRRETMLWYVHNFADRRATSHRVTSRAPATYCEPVFRDILVF